MSVVILKNIDGTLQGVLYGTNKLDRCVSSTNVSLCEPSGSPVRRDDMLKNNISYLMYPICNSSGIIIGKTFLALAFLVLGLKRYSENCMDRTGFFGIALTNFERIHQDFQEVLIQMIEFSWGSDCLGRFFQWFESKYKNRLALRDTISTVLSDEWKNITKINFNSI